MSGPDVKHLDLRGRHPRLTSERPKHCVVCRADATFQEVTVYNGATIKLDGHVVRHPVGSATFYCDKHTNRDLP